ncbi:CDP-diacylglycerol--glycerol-3-phosphate 3-phosphatidyltransferase [Parvibium lacunae]|uniref:CDP-diacylglycerol--glycerol-3-phosphate 3-phosphatidyltransferase n=1 Tax=Parvibium lacunae TaxID=1888893 RepID=A0A368L3K3_9BURK|nr:CDP-diacylglycerol--glycerol-3-phosphate 3-phosphatidyltransferase [Parvibium lacunae]RCS58063.1 CDP-diacylglycerol--glycerol-3-phosphate 3-phosphatidyltransferase [Parvibium lacunae]
MPFNLPILLTWLRIIAIPLLILLYYLPSGWLTASERDITATVLFIGAALTDWLDGYLARKWHQTSAFGAFLDPVADKLMVGAALLVLLHLGRTDMLAALIIIGREITISALREWMAQLGARNSVAVNWLGKVKTIAQMVAIPLLLYGGPLPILGQALALGTLLLWVAVVLTVWSMCYYLNQAWPVIKSRT